MLGCGGLWLAVVRTAPKLVEPIRITFVCTSNVPTGHVAFFGITNIDSRTRYIAVPQSRGAAVRGRSRAQRLTLYPPGKGFVTEIEVGRDYNVWSVSVHSIPQHSALEQWRERSARAVQAAHWPALANWIAPPPPRAMESKGPLMVRDKPLPELDLQ